MNKETLYAIAGIFLLTLSVCLVAITINYCSRKSKPTARINYGTMITYEFPVESPYQAARTYWILDNDFAKAKFDEGKRQERIDEIKKELEEYDD